jgi:glycosyltransferase involved in cell wall biosynthesis
VKKQSKKDEESQFVSRSVKLLCVDHKTVWGGGQVALMNLLREWRATNAPIEPLVVCPPDAALAERARAEGFACETYPLGAVDKTRGVGWNLIQRASPTRQLLNTMRRSRTDVVLANGAFSFLASMFAAKAARVPIVWLEQNTTLPSDGVVRRMIGAADRIVVISEAIRAQFAALAPEATGKMWVIYNGVDIKRFAPRDAAHASATATPQLLSTAERIPPHPLHVAVESTPHPPTPSPKGSGGATPHPLTPSPKGSGGATPHPLTPAPKGSGGGEEGGFVVGTVSRLSPEKGVEFFVEATNEIAKVMPNARFWIVGDGPLRGELERRAGDAVHFLGARDDVPELLHAMDVFVMPSLEEAFGIAVVEAMACGLPVVATNVGGLPEVVADKNTGLLVPPRDAGALASAVVKLANDESLRRAFGERGRARAEERFALAQTARQWKTVFGIR